MILQRRERKNRLLSVGAVTAAIAHELNSPLGAIALNARTALVQLRSNPPELEEVDDILKDIEADSCRASAIISSIRELSKNTTDRRAPTRVENVVRLVLRLVQHDLLIKEMSVATEFSDNIPDVHLDAIQFQQALLNLVRNAIDAMDSVAPERRRLRVTTSFNGSTVLLLVQDSGLGIPAEDRNRIFDPFFTTKSGGMGLGLAICSTAIESQGGKLRLIQSDSEGSSFEIAIPVSDMSPASQAPSKDYRLLAQSGNAR
jgi:C4-dicarboxylate-specific signal transduction histidine kinase